MPDEWELIQLHKFENMLAAGIPDTELESYVTDAGKGTGTGLSGMRKYFRYMKAIVMPPPTVAPCLACHGEWDTLDPAIQDQLNAPYPQV